MRKEKHKNNKKGPSRIIKWLREPDYYQNDGNLLRPARFRRGTAEQCFAPDSRAGLATHSAVLILCANITSGASGFNSTSATPKEKDDEGAKQRSRRLWWSRRASEAKRLITVLLKRTQQIKESKERVYRATRDDYAT